MVEVYLHQKSGFTWLALISFANFSLISFSQNELRLLLRILDRLTGYWITTFSESIEDSCSNKVFWILLDSNSSESTLF